MTLYNETGGDLSSRIEEVRKILSLLVPHLGELSQKEAKFVKEMNSARMISPKQLFWLRDLLDKYT
jgi:hypothetical protein